MSVNDVFPSCLSETLYMVFGMQDLLRKSIVLPGVQFEWWISLSSLTSSYHGNVSQAYI